MKKIFYLSFIFLLFNVSTCDKDKCHKTIAFVNNSPKEVYIGFTIRTLDTLSFYRNFSNPHTHTHSNNPYRVKSGETNTDALWNRNCYEYHHVADNNMFVYVFDAEVLETVSWDTVGKYYMVLKTISPTLEEMQRSNWTITFTGE